MSQVTSLIDDATRRAEESDLEHRTREALRKDLDRIRAYCESGLPTNGSAGLAIFCSSLAGLFEVMQLPRRVDPAVVIDRTPFIEPLAEYVTADRWAIALINRSSFRLFRGDVDTLHEVRAIHDVVHGQHDQGGWSQARFQRSVERDVQIHLTRVAEDLFVTFQHAPFDHLVIGTLNELWPAVQQSMHPYVAERIRGRIDVDVEHSAIDEVRAAFLPLLRDLERRRERGALDRLEQELGRGGRAAGGRTEVLRALDERRVDTLLVSPGASGGERATHLALEQAADVIVLRHHDLTSLDGIAALLRF